MVSSGAERYTPREPVKSRTNCRVIAAILLIGSFVGCQDSSPRGHRQVTRVVDGDTIILDGSERVRLIGVDTPESVDPRRPVQAFGKEAAEFTRVLLDGKTVNLVYEGNRRDRYGRTLAYVYTPDGTLANAAIIREGYGSAYTKYPFSKMDEFRRLELEARHDGRGLWGAR